MVVFRRKPSKSMKREEGSHQTKPPASGQCRPGIIVISSLVCLLFLFGSYSKTMMMSHSDSTDPALSINHVQTGLSEKTQLINCSLSFAPSPRRKESEWRKPIWLPSYPASGSASPSRQGDVIKEIIEKLTGLPGSVKNYHASMRNKLKRCKGLSETVACSNGHPYVNVGAEKQIQNFRKEVVFVIRNFLTAFPASVTDKGIAYHGKSGQIDEKEWKSVRDQYLESSFKAWKEMIYWWINADYYKVSIALPYEHLMDENKGPILIRNLSAVLTSSGFDVATVDDIPCIWYQVSKKESERQKILQNYIPSYTFEQKSLMMEELKKMVVELSQEQKHADLISLIKSYHDDVRDNTRLETS